MFSVFCFTCLLIILLSFTKNVTPFLLNYLSVPTCFSSGLTSNFLFTNKRCCSGLWKRICLLPDFLGVYFILFYFFFAYLSHLNVLDHKTNFNIKQSLTKELGKLLLSRQSTEYFPKRIPKVLFDKCEISLCVSFGQQWLSPWTLPWMPLLPSLFLKKFFFLLLNHELWP